MRYTKEELLIIINSIDKINKLVNTSELRKLFDKGKMVPENLEILNKILNAKTIEERQKLMNEFLLSNVKDENEVISIVYDVDTSEIQHEKLESGTEIIKFYSNKSHKNIYLEKPKDNNTLTEYLKEIQDENVKYQSDNLSKNTDSILEDQRMDKAINLEMIPVNKVMEHNYEINQLSDLEKSKLYFLIENSKKFHIEYINIKRIFGVSTLEYNSETFEATYDKKSQQFFIQKPKSEEELNIDKNLDETVVNSESEIDDDSFSNLDTVDDDITEIEHEEEVVYSESELEQAKIYIKYPELLNSLSSTEREKYQKIIKYIEKEKEKQEQLENKNSKKYVYKLDAKTTNNSQYGYISTAIIALISGFSVGILTASIIGLIKYI